MAATEEIQVTICKVSRPDSVGRFTAKHVPVPGGERRGVYERVFMSKSSVNKLLKNSPKATIVISQEAQNELSV
jgi:hypothetical protein